MRLRIRRDEAISKTSYDKTIHTITDGCSRKTKYFGLFVGMSEFLPTGHAVLGAANLV